MRDSLLTILRFDITNLQAKPDSINFDDVVKNSSNIQKIVEEEIALNGGDSTKVYVGGFSQGCALALHIGVTIEKQLGGIIGLSGFGFMQTKINQETFPNLKILLSHGTADGVVPILIAKMSYGMHGLLEKDNVEFIKVPNLGHGANAMTLKAIAQYWSKIEL